MKVAVIGGTGLSVLGGVHWSGEESLETEYGIPSAPLKTGQAGDLDLVFLPRHGSNHRLAPHLINYRANISALKTIGVTHIIAVNAVGGLSPHLPPESVAIPNQIIDYSYGREMTFFDGVSAPLQHIDFTEPYSESLRQRLLSAAKAESVICAGGGVYGSTQGPRLETAAEIKRLQRDGCDLVGMTGMPEAALAKELNLQYASICLVVNWGAGMTDQPITMNQINESVDVGMGKVKRILQRTFESWLRT